MELGADHAGVLYTRPRDSFDPTSSWDFRATSENSTDTREQINDPEYGLDYSESATEVIVSGTSIYGEEITRWLQDATAEGSILYDNFCPWRETEDIELPGTVGAGWVNYVTINKARELFPLKPTADLNVPVYPGLRRRNRVTVYGMEGQGVPDGTEFGILTLSHNWVAGGTITSQRTNAGLRRL